jgi:benzoyl-CoA reductase/2-hydroxyglutaryl-CoA dehydratase subunit BcrC/BadD/HgdB
MAYYDELLKICGFEPQEIDAQRARIEKAFQKLDLGPEDLEKAESWTRQNHDVALMGVRKILGLWLKELIDLVLAKEEGKSLVYFGFPTIPGPAGAIAASSEKIFCTSPDTVLCYTMGQIFNKLNPILEAGEENGLPPGHSLCSLQQIRVGGLAKGIIPVPDLVLTSSYYCDMGSKTDELLHERYGHPAVYVDGVMDSRWGEYPGYVPGRVKLLGAEIETIFENVKKVLGVEVNKEARNEGASRSRHVFGALNELVDLMMSADPQPISIVDVEVARRLTNGSTSSRIMNEGAKAIALLNQELKERIDNGIGVVEKGAPRTMIGVGHFSDPSIMRMIENTGLCIAGSLFSIMSANVKKKTSFISGPILAEEEMRRGIYHSTYGLVNMAAEAVKESQIDGFIWGYIFNCRPNALSSHLLKQFVEEQVGIPTLSLEMDMYDSRSYSAAALRTRVETFADMLKSRKMSAGH